MKDITHIHLIGVGGSGLSAIARVLAESGYVVSGSDQQSTSLTQSLGEEGISVFIGHHPENLKGADLVIRSSAIPDTNVEVQAARNLGIPVVKRAGFLDMWMTDKFGIAVAGTHGKTTTTAMIAWLLEDLNLSPTFIIGGVSKNLGTNARAGNGDIFLVEADEYDRMFLGLHPKIAVITNVDYDHPDYYPTRESYFQAFREFVDRIELGGSLMVCGDDPGAARLVREMKGNSCKVYRYGIPTQADSSRDAYQYMAGNLTPNQQGGYTFDLTVSPPEFLSIQVSLQVPGEHNVRNALAAFAVAHQLSLSPSKVVLALGEYKGTARRFDIRGEVDGVIVIDDYAHHPTEIKANLAAAKARFSSRKIWVVWQPHTFSRTRAFLTDFAAAFGDADQVIVSDVYASREQDTGQFSARQVVASMQHTSVSYIPSLPEVTRFLLDRLESGDVLLVFSAGDADRISSEVLAGLIQRKSPAQVDNSSNKLKQRRAG
jgi:UDP-N-acetylmuramate--alanine ligase